MSNSLNPTGSFCWFELATTDQNAAKDFYQSVFGWGVQDFPMGPDETYSLFKIDGKDVAAAYTMRPEQRAMGVPPHWLLYVMTDSADRTAALAKKLGGTVHAEPFDVMDHGRMCVIQDPTGAIFAAWEAKKNTGVGVKGTRNSMCWADLSTNDQAKAAKFYSQLFGWKMVAGENMKPSKPGEYYHIVNGKEMIGGVQPPQHRDPSMPAHWLLYFDVADTEAINASVTANGGRIVRPTMAMGNVRRFGLLADPQGAVFASVQALGGAETKDKPKPAAKAKAKAKPAAKAKSKPAAKAKSKAVAKAKSKSAAKAKSKTTPKAKAKSKTRSKPVAKKKKRR